MTDIADLYRRSVDEFDRRVAEIGEQQWGEPTPCSEWNVRDLVNHVTAEDLWAPPLLAGQTLDEVGGRFDGDVLGEQPQAAWARARDDAVAAVSAASLDRLVHTSMGEIPARDYLGQLFADHVVHAWDLARGIGADDRLDPALVEQCDRMARPHEAAMKASGVFGEQLDVRADAEPQARLLALFGRRS